MTATPLVVLDLGSTLIEGPAHGPARRIADLVGLDRNQKRAVHGVLMTVDFAGPDDAAATLRERLALDVPGLGHAVREVWAAQLGDARLLPGVRETLDWMVGCSRFAILSNIWTPFLASARDLLGDFFDRHVPAELQVFSCQAGLVKPASEAFTGLLARAGLAPGDVVMIGDSYDLDMRPALALGMRAIWVTGQPTEQLSPQPHGGLRPQPELTVGSFAELRHGDLSGSCGARTTVGENEKSPPGTGRR